MSFTRILVPSPVEMDGNRVAKISPILECQRCMGVWCHTLRNIRLGRGTLAWNGVDERVHGGTGARKKIGQTKVLHKQHVPN